MHLERTRQKRKIQIRRYRYLDQCPGHGRITREDGYGISKLDTDALSTSTEINLYKVTPTLYSLLPKLHLLFFLK